MPKKHYASRGFRGCLRTSFTAATECSDLSVPTLEEISWFINQLPDVPPHVWDRAYNNAENDVPSIKDISRVLRRCPVEVTPDVLLNELFNAGPTSPEIYMVPAFFNSPVDTKPATSFEFLALPTPSVGTSSPEKLVPPEVSTLQVVTKSPEANLSTATPDLSTVTKSPEADMSSAASVLSGGVKQLPKSKTSSATSVLSRVKKSLEANMSSAASVLSRVKKSPVANTTSATSDLSIVTKPPETNLSSAAPVTKLPKSCLASAAPGLSEASSSVHPTRAPVKSVTFIDEESLSQRTQSEARRSTGSKESHRKERSSDRCPVTAINDFITFPDCEVGERSLTHICLRNTSKAPANVKLESMPDGFSYVRKHGTGDDDDRVIKAGETRKLRIRFAPRLVCPYIGTCVFVVNDTTRLSCTLVGRGVLSGKKLYRDSAAIKLHR